MKVELVTYLHALNGVTLICLGETDIEKSLLKGLAKHGKLELNDGKLSINWKFESDNKEA